MKDLIQRFLDFHYLFIALLFSSCLISCNTKNESDQKKNSFVEQSEKSNLIKYASGFALEQKENFRLLHILRKFNDQTDTVSYVLIKEGLKIPNTFSHLRRVTVPVEKIALLHSSYVSFFDFCQSKDHIIAISEAKYIYDHDIYSAVEEGRLKEIGYGETLDKEQLLALDIELIVNVGWPNSPDKSEQLLQELGIESIVFSEWQENTLLGRTEWVKIIAALTGQGERVNREFEKLAMVYDSLVNLTANITDKPTVLCNLPYKGSWYVPGGNSYISQLISDSGATYLWAEDQGTGALQLDFESAYIKGINADFWVNPGLAHSIQDVIGSDSRLKDFTSVISGNVYNSNKRIVRDQSNDYWESGIVNPHLILADMIRIFHPQLLPDHELVYHKRVK